MLQRIWSVFGGESGEALEREDVPVEAADRPRSAAWYDQLVDSARTHGRMPYVVEGFHEVWDAVRRGHAVVLVRESAEVAEGVTVFAEGMTAQPQPLGAPRRQPGTPPLVTIRTFSMGRARFEVHDPHSASGALQLTPKRLQRYLEAPSRAIGVAIGA